MGMVNKEETLDWLYRLRSEIYVYMPREWLIPMNNALDVGIDTVKREKMLEDWTKKCRKFEADYENRLKADMAAMLDEIQLQAEENIENFYEKDEDDLLQLAQHNAFADCFEQYNDLIQQKINSLKEKS